MSYVMRSKRKYKKAFKSIRSSGTQCEENKADIALHRSMGLGQSGEAFPVRPAGLDCETQSHGEGSGHSRRSELRVEVLLSLYEVSTCRGSWWPFMFP